MLIISKVLDDLLISRTKLATDYFLVKLDELFQHGKLESGIGQNFLDTALKR